MIAAVYLAWAPLGIEPVRTFLASYREHPAGIEHELVLLLNGAGRGGPVDGEERELLLAELGASADRVIVLEQAPMQDLAAYGHAAAMLEHDRVCFLNSYSEILAGGWLASLHEALEQPGVGAVAATGSFESHAEWRRGSLRHHPQQILRAPGARREYPRFPNPHLRTNAFAIARVRVLELGFREVTDKRSAYRLESGRDGITARLLELGLRPLVVGADGRRYEIEQWPLSRTFRSAGQENLLVADNQTRDYDRASARRRRQLTRASWGPAAPSS
jgi:hypothetical protein